MGQSRQLNGYPPSPFTLEGRFLNFGLEDGFKLKWLWLATAEGEHCIKLSKAARASFKGTLRPGDWVRISGSQTHASDTGVPKLKADLIMPATPSPVTPPVEVGVAPVKGKATVLVCQKSDCAKRGSLTVCAALASALKAQGLESQVTIKATGCMKDCKLGPNLVFMPGKAHYHRARPEEMPALVEKYFPVVQPV
ncbi:hypothetical protein DO97_20300 [Neosynechococcus sphagnicola sy1]|uniref:(Fe-S)-binding protein n=1 Tax=Neosynechococcus sphagnicola sy1 TaxID=1497020 RepID=A0A098TMC8_9CYAN|nr:(2Fe-2S) ferredoxin domain-containing protein [Neosynechococcus sphagnicola]KGF73421.1 hypothetical protein DO97_20300 [Neosynechococcus sphagnicola sy1]